MSTVLVTGGSGFIGSFCILQLLSTGHHVRAMTDPHANGERFLAIAGDFLSMRDIALVLKKRAVGIGKTTCRAGAGVFRGWTVGADDDSRGYQT